MSGGQIAAWFLVVASGVIAFSLAWMGAGRTALALGLGIPVGFALLLLLLESGKR